MRMVATVQDAAKTSRQFGNLRRVVVKIGSALLAPKGVLEPIAVRGLADQIAKLRLGTLGAKIDVAVVSSGAVASGLSALNLSASPKEISLKQACAAVGQPKLMAAWADAFARHGLSVAQVLYTAEDLDRRDRYLNTRRTLDELLERGVVPIINENDTTSFAEIKLGDNDRLSALTADLIDADLLIILSTAQGIYSKGTDKPIARCLHNEDLSMHVRTEKSSVGTGGIVTKIEAAQMAGRWGVATVIAGGAISDVVARVIGGQEIGTYFSPAGLGKAQARKRWIGASARAKGSVVIDDGAVSAICSKGASLLPGGIVSVVGAFAKNQTIDIRDAKGKKIARGIASYGSEEIGRIMGHKAQMIEKLLGYCYQQEVVHRDDMVVIDARKTSVTKESNKERA